MPPEKVELVQRRRSRVLIEGSVAEVSMAQVASPLEQSIPRREVGVAVECRVESRIITPGATSLTGGELAIIIPGHPRARTYPKQVRPEPK